MTGATGLAALVALLLLAAPGDCPEDAATLASEADALVATSGPRPDASALEAARRLYRRARVLSPSAAFSLSAADLACAAGDGEECGDLLSEAAEMSPASLSPADRLLLARRAESRRAWREAISHYQALRTSTPDSSLSSWAQGRIRRLEIETEAQSIPAPAAAVPPPEARLALAEARRALAAGDLRNARERLAIARRLSAGYPDAALVLAAVETREGRVREAIQAYRETLSADPARFEALVGLANLLWDEPDRAAKEEALALTDRALDLRPDSPALLKTSALRRAEWGDAPKALARLDAYRRRASPEEKQATEALRESLARRVDALLSGASPAGEPEVPELSSPAVDEWKVAQAYVRRADPASLASALEHLREAERLDPTFAPAPELAGSIYEMRGEFSLAEKAYERAIAADPARAGAYERLAFLLARQPGREADAEEAWRRAEQAGSSEALHALAVSAARKGRPSEALALYKRYLAESPGGVHAEEDLRSVARLESARRTNFGAIAGAAAALLLAASVVGYRRFGGRTFEEWIRANPARAHEARPIVGRFRHEVVKHGGLLLSDAAKRLSEPDPEARRRTAELLRSRLFGASAARGLLAESADAFERLRALARADGVRLNLERKDPRFSPIANGSRILRRLEKSLDRIAEEDDAATARITADLDRAASLFRLASGAGISRVLDEASSTRASVRELQAVLDRVCAERELASSPSLGWSGPEITVRVDPGDWDTIWRNLFANALDAAGEMPVSDVRLGVFAQLLRDPVTGTPVARIVLADNVPRPLTAEMIRGRAADRGWGVVADLVRRNEGTADVGPPPASSYRKGIVLELPALEPEGPA